MCSVAGLVTGGLSIGKSAVDTKRNLAEQQSVYNREVAQWQRESVEADIAQKRTLFEAAARANEAALNYTQLTTRQQEANEAAQQEKGDIAIQAAKARSLAAVGAAEAGVRGASVERIMNDIGVQAQRQTGVVEQNRANTNIQAQQEKEAVRLKAQTAPAYTYVGSAPSTPRTGLTIASGIMSGLSGGIDAIGRYAPRTSSAYKSIYGSA